MDDQNFANSARSRHSDGPNQYHFGWNSPENDPFKPGLWQGGLSIQGTGWNSEVDCICWGHELFSLDEKRLSQDGWIPSRTPVLIGVLVLSLQRSEQKH